VGKWSWAGITQSVYEENTLKCDTEVTITKVGNKIDALRISYREALGLQNQTGNRITLDGTIHRDKELEKWLIMNNSATNSAFQSRNIDRNALSE